MLNYKKNNRYFHPKKKFNTLVFVLGIVAGVGTAAYFYFLGGGLNTLIDTTNIIIYSGVIVFGTLLALFINQIGNVKGSFVDKQILAESTNFDQILLDNLKVPQDDLQIIKPIKYQHYVFDSKYQTALTATGGDGVSRSSQYCFSSIVFSSNKFFSYRYEFSLIKPWSVTTTIEYYYIEISSYAIEEVHEGNTVRVRITFYFKHSNEPFHLYLDKEENPHAIIEAIKTLLKNSQN